MTPVTLRAGYDDRHGGRWTSLAGGGREWLWRRDDAARGSAVPGGAFVDAGGLEECVPTVRGTPDHGDAWCRPWQTTGPDISAVTCCDFTLTRRVTHRAGAVVADYLLRADPGYRFVWAAHALLDLSPDARLDAPAGAPTRVYPDSAPPDPDPRPGRHRRADDGDPTAPSPWRDGPWPAPTDVPLDRFGPDDGTAIGAVLVGCSAVRVVDGADTLTFALDCAGQPRSTALWRNLAGWPAATPYRSTGVEPMLGSVFDLATAGPGDAATVPATGEVAWRLTITAQRSSGGDNG